MANFFDQIFGNAAAQLEPVVRELGQWFAVLQRHALQKWSPIVLSGVRCSVRVQREPCRNAGIAKCALCGQATCLRHAAIGFDATAICEQCLDDYKSVVEAKAKARPEPEPAKDDPAAQKRAALRKLGLTADSTWDEVRSEYRSLVKKYHPDKHANGTAAEKKRAAAKMVEINDAYAVLERLMKE